MKTIIFIIFIILFLMYPINSYCYIDPGTGSLWLQYLCGGVASVYFLVKVYFEKIKEKFFPQKTKKLPDNFSEQTKKEIKNAK